ncbi:MAG: tetratricopeptide repeat protein [Deltaproteobacteria bacterium]|nr:tetratricopeptide repeat protein [Deltaproteobacteria bacterium]
MLNWLISIAVLLVVLGAGLVLFDLFSALLFAFVAGIVCVVLLGRRLAKKLEAGMEQVQQTLIQLRFDQAIAQLEALRPLTRWQKMVSPMLDAQIGIILYAYKEQLDRALPYLERAPKRQWQAKAMLGALYFRRKDYARMEQTFERAVKANRKAGLLWSSYAWCQLKRGEQQRAIEVLARARKHLPKDERIRNSLLSLQNDRKLKMRGYGDEWWALRLQRPPAQQPAFGGGRRRMIGRR